MSKKVGDLVSQGLADWGGLDGAQSFGRRTKYIRTSRELSQQDEIGQVEHSMRIWGINPEKDKMHELFWDTIIGAVKDCLHHTGFFHLFGLSQPSWEELSGDVSFSVQQLCVQEIQDLLYGDEMIDVADRLYPNVPSGPPYLVYRDGATLKDSYAHLQEEQLDPLQRFYAVKGSPVYMIRRQYTQMGLLSIGCCTALILRSLVIQAACKSAKCAGCQSISTLRWNKGSSETKLWRRMICVHCNAAYEIKMVKDLESKLNVNGDNLTISGGTLFGSYQQMRWDSDTQKESEYKMFLAMIDSSCLEFPTSSMRKVYVGQIKHAVPFLKPKAFLWRDVKRYCIHTKMTLHPAVSWCRVDVPNAVRNPVAYFESVFDFTVALPVDVPNAKAAEAAPKEMDPDLATFSQMTQEELKDHYRDLRRKIARIMALTRKKREDLTDEEISLVESMERVEKEAAKCKKYVY